MYVLFVSSWALYLLKPLSRTLSPSRWRNSSRAGPAASLLYISSSLLWPAMQYITPTFRWKLSCKEKTNLEWKVKTAILPSCQSHHVDILDRMCSGIWKIASSCVVNTVPFPQEIMLTFSAVLTIDHCTREWASKSLFSIFICICQDWVVFDYATLCKQFFNINSI